MSSFDATASSIANFVMRHPQEDLAVKALATAAARALRKIRKTTDVDRIGVHQMKRLVRDMIKLEFDNPEFQKRFPTRDRKFAAELLQCWYT